MPSTNDAGTKNRRCSPTRIVRTPSSNPVITSLLHTQNEKDCPGITFAPHAPLCDSHPLHHTVTVSYRRGPGASQRGGCKTRYFNPDGKRIKTIASLFYAVSCPWYIKSMKVIAVAQGQPAVHRHAYYTHRKKHEQNCESQVQRAKADSSDGQNERTYAMYQGTWQYHGH
mgnify:CR=1 FL=1